MVRHRPDFDYDEDEYYFEVDDLLDAEEDDLLLDDEEDLESLSPDEFPSGEHGVEISMEVDAEGKEIWYAQDPRVPGSSSIGHSAEEAVEGVEDRRREYRELLQKSREGILDDETEPIPPPDSVSGEHDVDISMEVDESGREIWYAKDPRVPGSRSIGHSAEEAVDGLEERRREYREILKKSRSKRGGRDNAGG